MSTRSTPKDGLDEEREGLLQLETDSAPVLDVPIHEDPARPTHGPGRVIFIRTLALLCACSLSIGAH
jgi:hypothetical protein